MLENNRLHQNSLMLRDFFTIHCLLFGDSTVHSMFREKDVNRATYYAM